MEEKKNDFCYILKNSSPESLLIVSEILKSDAFKEKIEKEHTKLAEEIKEGLKRLHENPKLKTYFEEIEKNQLGKQNPES
jgi:hypothetical protein